MWISFRESWPVHKRWSRQVSIRPRAAYSTNGMERLRQAHQRARKPPQCQRKVGGFGGFRQAQPAEVSTGSTSGWFAGCRVMNDRGRAPHRQSQTLCDPVGPGLCRSLSELRSEPSAPAIAADLLPLDSSWRLRRDVEHDAVDAVHLVRDAIGDLRQHVVGQARPVRRHGVL